MLCKVPFRPSQGVEYGCGQCIPCRVNKRRLWTARIILEASSYREPSSFVTLTYAPQWLPEGGTLVPAHADEFRYKLRYHLGRGFRYYYVGEYGERSGRPHYHFVLFGVMPDAADVLRIWAKCESQGVVVGSVTFDSAAYVAGYVTKKWTGKDDPNLRGRYPEFSRMSRKPGIGVPGLQGVINWLYTSDGAAYMQRFRDVPKSLRFGGKVFPLGRYLVERLRLEFGIDVSDRDPVRAKLQTLARLEQALPELSAIREAKRVGHAQRVEYYRKSKRAKEII